MENLEINSIEEKHNLSVPSDIEQEIVKNQVFNDEEDDVDSEEKDDVVIDTLYGENEQLRVQKIQPT